MEILAVLASLAFIVLVLRDGFESMILPRRVTRTYRPARLYYRATWTLWRGVARHLPPGKHRENFLSVFGPLSLLGLFGFWALGLIFGFAALNWSLGTPMQAPDPQPGLGSYLYLSGGTFFTLGFGDLYPLGPLGRVLAVVEAGLGFCFLAAVIGYLPVLYQAFSRRELTISLLDARAGSPPTAAEMLLRMAQAKSPGMMDPFLAEWERWSGDLLESHLSFPVLSYYRSQHDNQSWLAALTAVLDSCAVLMACVKGPNPYQAQLTFAMARHAVVDLALVFKTAPRPSDSDRLPEDQRARLQELLRKAGWTLRDGPASDARLAQLRALYEPFVRALADHLLFALPPVLSEKAPVDNWQTTAWARRAPGIGRLPGAEADEHFD
jgi:hypothetical protein